MQLNKISFLSTSIAAGVLIGAALYAMLPGMAGLPAMHRLDRPQSADGVVVASRSDQVSEQIAGQIPGQNDSEKPAIAVDHRRPRDSYHEGIMQVAPSVVSLYSTETRHTPARRATDDDNEASAPQGRRSTSQGSGVIVSSDGMVLTNFHLVDGADDINVVLSDGSLHQARIIGSDRETDLAVVHIDATALPAVAIEGAPPVRVGDIVLAIGNPFGVGQTVTQGIVSATRRRVAGGSAWQNFVQIDAAINPGNSGGALISPSGRLVGVNTAVFLRGNGAEGIGFAIPAELLAQVVPQIIADGRVIRGWLGIGADDLPMFPDINRHVKRGAVITGVLPDSPAERGGLHAYDVVTRLDKTPIDNATELLLLVSSLQPGNAVDLDVLRNGASRSLQVKLGERPVIDDSGAQPEASTDRQARQ